MANVPEPHIGASTASWRSGEKPASIEDGGRKRFADRRQPGIQAIAAHRQRTPRRVDVDAGNAVMPMQMQARRTVWRPLGIGTTAQALHETVRHGILATQQGKARIPQRRNVRHRRRPAERTIRAQIQIPRQFGDLGIELVRRKRLERSQLEQHAVGRPRPQVDAHRRRQIAIQGNCVARRRLGVGRRERLQAERAQFRRQGLFAAPRSRDDESSGRSPIHRPFSLS